MYIGHRSRSWTLEIAKWVETTYLIENNLKIIFAGQGKTDLLKAEIEAEDGLK